MSSEIWFTADQHFGHHNETTGVGVVQIMKRPFDNVDIMADAIISFHNDVVKNGDRVYNLGDFAWKDHEKYRKCLNGQQFLIKGNHDQTRYLENAKFGWVKDVCMLKAGMMVWMSHYAHRVWPQSNYGTLHAYGHSHGMIEDHNRSTDVGVDRMGFRPIHLDELIAILANRPKTNHHPEAA